jgi:hypothetical protein
MVGVVVYSFFGVVAYMKLRKEFEGNSYDSEVVPRVGGSILWPITLIVVLTYCAVKLAYSPIGAIVRLCEKTEFAYKVAKVLMVDGRSYETPKEAVEHTISRMVEREVKSHVRCSNEWVEEQTEIIKNWDERIGKIEKAQAKQKPKKKRKK